MVKQLDLDNIPEAERQIVIQERRTMRRMLVVALIPSLMAIAVSTFSLYTTNKAQAAVSVHNGSTGAHPEQAINHAATMGALIAAVDRNTQELRELRSDIRQLLLNERTSD